METHKFIQQPNSLEPFTPSGNTFFDSRIVEKRDQYELFWKEYKTDGHLSIPKKLEGEIETLEFLSKLYSSIKKSGKTYDEHCKTFPDFENRLEKDFRLSEGGLGWPGEIKDEFMKINLDDNTSPE